jgi:hypothetical protein
MTDAYDLEEDESLVEELRHEIAVLKEAERERKEIARHKWGRVLGLLKKLTVVVETFAKD